VLTSLDGEDKRRTANRKIVYQPQNEGAHPPPVDLGVAIRYNEYVSLCITNLQ